MTVRFHRGGVHLPALGLWLDPHDPVTAPQRVFISHAHSDHIGVHGEAILSKPTSRFMHTRLGGDWKEHVLAFGEPAEFEGGETPFRITLLPAGHIFGSAMSFIEADGTSLLYTGDFKLRAGLSAEKCEPRQADTLIMETTYGRPAYEFPPTSDVLRGVIQFCRDALLNEETPVLLGYSLGKSQELLCGLAEASLPIALHSTVYRLTKIYEQFGKCFPAYEKFESSSSRGRVLVCPPNAVSATMLRNLGPSRLAVLTGWAVDPNCRYRYQAHAAFPLSDHADFHELIEFVRLVNPKQIYTLHGFAADFAQTLRELGYQAQALSEEEQLTLPLALPFSPLRTAGYRLQDSSAPASLSADAGPGSLDLSVQAGGAAHGLSSVSGLSHEEDQMDLFHKFALTCSQIRSTAKKGEKIAFLATYLQSLDPASVRIVSTWFTGHPFPSTENKILQLGWAIIRDALCQVTEMDQSEFGQFYLRHSDLGETAFEILQKRAAPQSRLRLQDVHLLFLSLQSARGPFGKLPLLIGVLRQSTALEGKYLVKILTGDLRIGLKEGLVEEAIAQAYQVPLDQVKNVNLLLGNIGETAERAQRGAVEGVSLVPFRPVKFMLASPEENAADIWQRVLAWSRAGENAASKQVPLLVESTAALPSIWLEDKYDGIRCQLHKVGSRVSLYSRDLREVTNAFLEVADRVRSFPSDFVADGELVAMRGDAILPFSELQKRLGRREGDLFLGQQIPVEFVGFDLLWREGRTLLEEPLRSRRLALEQIANERLRLAQITQVHSVAEIEKAFTEARSRDNEGLMIKDPSSSYTPGRRGLAWLKLKQAFGTLDCIVVRVEYGHGKRKAVLSDYTFAVRDETTGELKTIGKAYSGLTDVEIAELTKHFLAKAIRQHGRYLDVQPDIILEIAFDAVQVSERHDSGLALRFPRIARIRRDKTLAEIDTLGTARKLVKAGARRAAVPG